MRIRFLLQRSITLNSRAAGIFARLAKADHHEYELHAGAYSEPEDKTVDLAVDKGASA
jgi:hypothetical protein